MTKRTECALPTESGARKNIPLASGCLDYFPSALAAVAALSKAGNDKHNPGQPLHHARGKSTDHADCILRHLTDRGTVDPEDGIRHSAKVAWRALALLQEELEASGAPLARGAKLPSCFTDLDLSHSDHGNNKPAQEANRSGSKRRGPAGAVRGSRRGLQRSKKGGA